MASKLVMLEFNELCPTLMDRFIDQGYLPNFARLKRESFVYTTEAEEQAPYLEPWIQWVTVHTGLPYSEHGVFDLDDGHKLDEPRVWDLLGQRGDKVWICGSMNASFRKPIDGYVLPDPWSTGIHPYPEGEFTSYYDFVRLNVQEHTRESMPVGKSAQLRFLAFMMTHGMTAETAASIMKQLIEERSGGNRWKRAVLLDSLQWDVFRAYWKKLKPKFSTFFLNSTAHFQHLFWRNMEPSLFAAQPSEGEQAEYENAIRFGYQHMDQLVGKALAMIDPDTTLVLATALSQQPCLKYEDSGGKVFYRIENVEKFFRFFDIKGFEYSPVMSEQFRLTFESEAEAEDAERKMLSLKLNGKTVMLARRTGAEIFAGCSIFTRVDRNAQVDSSAGPFRFYEHFYDCNSVKSGMHHPDGIFWVNTPAREGHGGAAKRVRLLDVAPTLLTLCDYRKPKSMKGHVLEETVGSSVSLARGAKA